MLSILAQNIALQNARELTHTYRTWYEQLREPLHQVTECLGILFPVFLYNIPPFWLPSLVQAEYCLDEQRVHLYVEAMERATISEMLAYLMVVGLSLAYKGPTALVRKLVLEKSDSPQFSFLVYTQNQKNWLYALLEALDPAGSLKLKTQLELNIQAILIWIYSTWINVAGIMHPLDEPSHQ